MLTRTTWLMGGLAIVALAAASTAAAEEHRDKDSVARFLAAPSCEISSHDSDDHFRAAHGGVGGNLLGGSYGEIFFANGAGARAAAASSTSGESGSSAGGGSNSGAPSSGNGGSATNAPGTTGPQTPGLTAATSKASVKADPVPGGTGGGVVTKGDPVAGNPEPASLLLLGTGLGSVLIARRRQGRRDRD